MKSKEKYVIGIDGCKFGWVAVSLNSKKEFNVTKHQKFDEIIQLYDKAEFFLVDMVIGLADKNHPRTLDQLAREKLKPYRTSTVFTPPCRAAVYEKDYLIAREKNKLITNKSISIQAWNIVPKIKEVDQFLQKNSIYSNKIIEAHPEVCFSSLNNNTPMFFKKSIKDGENERLALIDKKCPSAKVFFERNRSFFLKKDVKNDDFLDALCLAITGYIGLEKGLNFLQDENFRFDGKGLEMRMAFIE